MDPSVFFKCLADNTRLKLCCLIYEEQELCVCDLIAALNEAQPKISRHLAQLRNCRILVDERRSQWVYYQINPELPEWARGVLNNAVVALDKDLEQLKKSLAGC
ncbi:metalloregulator ArsR/SmtB family transcription factor [Teredinibacter turnerae]|nr:metalloregulator ArsR/SmtB family transcription factor [Teredinibacter turnerae]